jgi:alpha-beta hydrolase superfamily lysophospholipase
MIDLSRIHHPAFDKPEICRILFYPRRESFPAAAGDWERLTIPAEEGVTLGGRFHAADRQAPTILFFHGNGEIAGDYDDIGPLYNRIGINFLPVDYRGYGVSTGSPTVTAMLRDAHWTLAYVTSWLKEKGFKGPLVVMGRSLGSAPALELAVHGGGTAAGLIIESGFARILPLLKLLGIDDPELTEAQGPLNLEKIRQIKSPTLVIHAQCDRIIPPAEGVDLYRASGAEKKMFLEIPGADHNDILFRGMKAYMEAIEKLVEIVRAGGH